MSAEPQDVFAAIERASAAHELEILVIGGHAVNAYGYTRTTFDVDFLIPEDGFPAMQACLEQVGYRTSGKNATFARMEPIMAGSSAPRVDVMLVDRSTFEKMREGQRALRFGLAELPAPTPLFLIALKLHAMKNEARRKIGKDLVDILALIRVCEIDSRGIEFQGVLEKFADAPSRALLENALGDV